MDPGKLGAIVTKGVSAVPWEGNPTPRVAETPSGMLNAIGLQNPGFEVFAHRDLKFLSETLLPDADPAGSGLEDIAYADAGNAAEACANAAAGNPANGGIGTKVVVNVCGHSEEEYIDCVEKLAQEPRADLLEINISCPNVREGGIAFGTDPKGVERITAAIRKAARQPVIMKLSPNVTSIAEIARAAEAGGADAVSLINTLTGMKIDVERRTFALANRTGGLSGPAIHPVAVRMVYECAHAVRIPVIGMGGIQTAEDALEMILAGACAVSVGTASFHDQTAVLSVIDGIADYLQRHRVPDIRDLVGCL
jgi:dihydroorotate dehydrogenase (NAD+) catalytic subunit